MESENIKALLDYIPEELERLAEIGRAIKKAFEQDFTLENETTLLTSVSQLKIWHESNKESEERQ